MNAELKKIEKRVKKCLIQADLTISPIVFFGYKNSGGNDQVKYVLYEDNEWSLVYYERGRATSLVKSDDMDDIVYKIILDSARVAADELCDRKSEIDRRRCEFKKTVEILQKIEMKWAQKTESYFVEILKRHPYDDDVRCRLDLLRKLKLKGMTHEEAQRLAEEKYPKPELEKNPQI